MKQEYFILQKTAIELGDMIRNKEITSVSLTNMFLERLQLAQYGLNAVSEITAETALTQASLMDKEVQQGQFRGPLHGVPYGAKDLLSTVGIPTRWGSPAHADQVIDTDATVITRLRDAGAVLIGKLAMVELAGGGSYSSASASLHGPGRNPWSLTQWAGGSSSGSGAAMAASAVGFAIGTETWGSITVPAAFCGVSGLRPTYGRVSRNGAMALCWTLDKVGPMARSAQDCGVILEAIAGPDPQDSTAATIPFQFIPSTIDGRQLKIGVLQHDYANAQIVQDKFKDALSALGSFGHTFADAVYPEGFPYNELTGLIVNAEGSASFQSFILSDKIKLLADKGQQAGLLTGLNISAADYISAQRLRSQAVKTLNTLWDQFDLLIAPTLLTEAISAEIPFMEQSNPWGGNGGPGNLAGWPCISVPMGFGANNLPLGLEIIGPNWSENTILCLAAQYQKLTEWHRMLPPFPVASD